MKRLLNSFFVTSLMLGLQYLSLQLSMLLELLRSKKAQFDPILILISINLTLNTLLKRE